MRDLSTLFPFERGKRALAAWIPSQDSLADDVTDHQTYRRVAKGLTRPVGMRPLKHTPSIIIAAMHNKSLMYFADRTFTIACQTSRRFTASLANTSIRPHDAQTPRADGARTRSRRASTCSRTARGGKASRRPSRQPPWRRPRSFRAQPGGETVPRSRSC